MPTTTKLTHLELETLRLPELQATFAEVTGETSRSPNKKFLIRRIEEAYESMDALEKGKAMRAEAETEKPAPKKKGRKKAKAADDAGADGEPKVSKMSVEELRAKHLELTGRETKSTNRTYLVWRVSQAMKGKVPTGPRPKAGPHKVLPVRVPEAAVQYLDGAWKAMGLKSRQDFLTRAIHDCLAAAGRTEAASHFSGEVQE